MQQPFTSKDNSDTIGNGVFLVGLGILIFTNAWWPHILLVIWASLATRQLLTRRLYDFGISTLFFIGLFVLSLFKINWSILMPVLFIIGGSYLIVRELFFPEKKSSKENDDDNDNSI